MCSSYPHMLVAAWMRILLTFLIIWVSLVLANITNFPVALLSCNRNSGCTFLYEFLAKKFEQIIIDLSTPTIESQWIQLGVMAASHSYMMKVWCFVSENNKVSTELILFISILVLAEVSYLLPSKCYCGVVSAISGHDPTGGMLLPCGHWP